jgi:hypothetical protein
MSVTNPKYSSENERIIVTDEHPGGFPATVGNMEYFELIESGAAIAAYVAPAVTWDEVRADRNRRLAETDFHALSDVSMSDEMTAYRQALRDVPGDNADPGDISWPTKP